MNTTHDLRGFSTLEILIAMAIMISTLSAVILVSFGDQSLLGQAGVNAQAEDMAEAMLEAESANARQDFRMVTDSPTSTDGMYQKSLSVADVPSDPYTTKRVIATVSWQDERHITRSVSLTELLTDFDDPSTENTCDSALAGNWKNPSIINYAFASGTLLPTNAKIAASNTIGAVDAYHGMLYVVDATRSAKTDDSLFAFDISNPKNPLYRGSFDTATTSVDGMNAIVVAGSYAYVANAHGATFKSCKPAGNCSQLQIFNVSDPTAISLVADYLLPTSTIPYVLGTGGQAIGNTLYYTDGYLYLGLVKTQSGPEFNIIDVHDPTHPVWLGGYAIGATISQIYVRGDYAYLATDDQSREEITLNVHDPRNPYLVASFDPKGTSGQEYGESLYARGDQLFVGMSSTSVSGSPELYALDITHASAPSMIASTEISSTDLDMFVRDSVAFVLASTLKQFQSWDVSNPVSIAPYAAPLALPGTGVSMDCEGDYFYIGSNNGPQGTISVIGPAI